MVSQLHEYCDALSARAPLNLAHHRLLAPRRQQLPSREVRRASSIGAQAWVVRLLPLGLLAKLDHKRIEHFESLRGGRRARGGWWAGRLIGTAEERGVSGKPM